MTQVVYVVSLILQMLFFGLGLYYFAISLFCWYDKPRKKDASDRLNTFALVVAAHNEEAVIENLVDSLNQINYPRDHYEIFVIADNCTDQTAKLARERGAKVYERFNDKEKGKGYALEWMFNQIFEMEEKYDYISVFDADNLISPEFLNATNRELNAGYRVVQGYIDSKNPTDSWISAAYSLSFWCTNKLFQKSRYNLGLSCQLCGTGFTVETELIKEIGWGATCLTEDIEFTMKLAEYNIRVGWANDAVVYDEKPLTLSQSWKQRVRWMQGHSDVSSRYFFKLIKQSIKEHNFFKFDCAIYLLQPLRIITMGVITLMAWMQTVYPDGNWGFFQMAYLFPSSAIWMALVIAEFMWTPFVLLTERRLSPKMFLYCITYLVYSLTWVPIAVIGVVNKNKKEWFHTQHTRKIALSDIEN